MADCPACPATGRVEARLPARKRLCQESNIKREKMLKRMVATASSDC